MSNEQNNDVFEEFEFKPLTDGLGFHKKSIDLKNEMASAGVADRPDPKSIPRPPEALFDLQDEIPPSYASITQRGQRDFGKSQNLVEDDFLAKLDDVQAKPEIQRPLPRTGETPPKNEAEKTKPEPRFVPQLDLNFKENTKKKIEETSAVTTADLRVSESQATYKTINTNITSSVFDAIVAFTFSILFLVAMITITKVDLVELIFNAKTQLVIQGSLVLMYFAILQLYFIISRVVGGATLGEWAFDVHVAEEDDKRGSWFALRIILRATVNMLTGFVVLPLLSLVLRKDLAGKISGTRLFQQI